MTTLTTELVWLSNEEFPRLRHGGRLVWLGRHGAAPNYHDPEAAVEAVSTPVEKAHDDDPEYIVTYTADPAAWCPSLPEGVYMASRMDVAEIIRQKREAAQVAAVELLALTCG